MWLDIEDTNTHTYWGLNRAASKNFLIGLLDESVRRLGHNRVGIYSSYYMWELIFGDASWSCCNAYPLWYANYDGARSFADFRGFGGWASPSRKQYAGDATVCSSDVDLNWWP